MQVNSKNVHKYLGMILEYNTVDPVKIAMLDYIYEILDTFDKEDPTVGSTISSVSPEII